MNDLLIDINQKMKYSAVVLLITVAFVAFSVAEAKLKRIFNDFNIIDVSTKIILLIRALRYLCI